MASNKKSGGYSMEMVQAAIDDVRKNGMTIRGSARLHGVPESTLRRRLSDPRGADVLIGGSTIFTKSEESQLAQHCIDMADRGYGYTRWQILELAANMSKAKDKQITPTKHWFYGFLKRFPQVKMVQPKKREKVRSDVTTASIDSYFIELKNVLEQYNLLDKPNSIWNVDETGISLDHSPPKILSRRGDQPFCVTSGRSCTTTLVAAVSALGQTIPPYIIYKGQRLTQELVSDGMEGSKFTTSANGWVTSDIFLDFFKNHFLQHVTQRPAILLYDGHSTHITYEIIETARQSNVHLFVLPPHSSHMLQPLDVSVFSPFKKHLNSEMHKYMHNNPTCVITRQLLPRLISTAYTSSMTVSNIMAGFRKTGIFPFNPDTIHPEPPKSIEIPSTTSKPTRQERQHSRSIKILFENTISAFDSAKTTNEPAKKKRKTFIPPFGAAITEQHFRDMIKEKEIEKEKTTTKLQTKPAPLNSTSKPKSNAHKQGKFQTPFNSQLTSTETTAINTKKGNSSTTPQTKGKGKALAKKSNKKILQVEDNNDDEIQIEDNEKCCICKKFQPDGLRLDQAITFVSWAQCEKCSGWVHLRYCSSKTAVTDSEEFFCAKCEN